ncbi:MAG: polynucleotide adenylyltransferase, partial [Candidatus Latescibacterota bacterium]
HHMFFYRPGWTRATVRRFIRRVGETGLEDLFLLRQADCRSRDKTDELGPLEELRERIERERRESRAFKIADLAVDGSDVMDVLGVGPGPEIGRILGELLDLVVEKPELNQSTTLRQILKDQFSR